MKSDNSARAAAPSRNQPLCSTFSRWQFGQIDTNKPRRQRQYEHHCLHATPSRYQQYVDQQYRYSFSQPDGRLPRRHALSVSAKMLKSSSYEISHTSMVKAHDMYKSWQWTILMILTHSHIHERLIYNGKMLVYVSTTTTSSFTKVIWLVFVILISQQRILGGWL